MYFCTKLYQAIMSKCKTVYPFIPERFAAIFISRPRMFSDLDHTRNGTDRREAFAQTEDLISAI